jgi:hypothetical protein
MTAWNAKQSAAIDAILAMPIDVATLGRNPGRNRGSRTQMVHAGPSKTPSPGMLQWPN